MSFSDESVVIGGSDEKEVKAKQVRVIKKPKPLKLDPDFVSENYPL